jgi:hypothetical protein
MQPDALMLDHEVWFPHEVCVEADAIAELPLQSALFFTCIR